MSQIKIAKCSQWRLSDSQQVFYDDDWFPHPDLA